VNATPIVALDVPRASAAMALVGELGETCGFYKVGNELFTAAGPSVVAAIREQGREVFLDLKFHDIPNTVAQACAAATRLGVWMLDVHAAGGRAMLAAAREAVTNAAAAQGRPSPLLIAVTVLTSLADVDLRETGVAGTATQQALDLARLAAACGLDGVVCSAVEAPAMRAARGKDFKLVTPGIRPAGSSHDDQARVITPSAAVANGADYLVVGRPITQAVDPLAALAAINASLEGTA
jgi:orotidine-5'-phosphate decarboxylase